MSKKESKKQDKKKLLILVLLLFAVVGLAGYGVYSYYWTQSTLSGNSNDVTIAAFDPEVSVTSGFLGDGGEITLVCPDSSTGEGTVTCTGELQVTNNGGTAITVSTSNPNVTVSPFNGNGASASAGTPSFSWSNTTIATGTSETLTISVPVYISSDFASDEAVYRSSEYDSNGSGDYEDSLEVKVGFKITASQVH